jgi:2-methylcitrate dehydratase PrpD
MIRLGLSPRASYADLPASAIESAGRDILDTLGCMLGGSGSPGIVDLFAVVSRWGGLAESRVLLRLTPPQMNAG